MLGCFSRPSQLPGRRGVQVHASEPSRVVVLGGSGRVGSSTASALLKLCPDTSISLLGRSRENYTATIERAPDLAQTSFIECDVDDGDALRAALEGADLVIHTAGPFQQKTNYAAIDAAIAAGTPYMDVCDDLAYSKGVLSRHGAAAEAGVPAITTAGIYPGVSNLMAAHMLACARNEVDEKFNLKPEGAPEDARKPTSLTYSYFTAGTGGVGPTILETSFLLAGEPALTYVDGVAEIKPPFSGFRVRDFGEGLGRRSTYLLNLPEVESAYKIMGVPTVSARFGTDPEIWNIAMEATAKWAPKGLLQDRERVKAFSEWVGPLVRFTDALAGERVGMLVELNLEGGKNCCGIFLHQKLSESVGQCTASIARAMLSGQTQPGVWYPEQREAISDRRGVLKDASEGCTRFELNRPYWELQGEAVQIGMGFYW